MRERESWVQIEDDDEGDEKTHTFVVDNGFAYLFQPQPLLLSFFKYHHCWSEINQVYFISQLKKSQICKF